MVSLKTSENEDSYHKILIIRNIVVKNLCDKVSKIKNLSQQFCCIFYWLSRGVLHFFWELCFHGEICKTKWPLFNFFEKTEKSRLWTSNFSIKTVSNKIFFELILMPVPRGSFWTPSLYQRPNTVVPMYERDIPLGYLFTSPVTYHTVINHFECDML